MQEFLSDFTQMWALKYVRSFVVTRIRLVKLCCVRLYTVAHVVQNKNHNTSPAEAVARSIVMSTSVCLSVCPTGYLGNHTDDLYQFFCAWCLWPWLSPPPAGWRNPNGKGQFWGFFLPHLQCIVTRSLHITSCSSRRGVMGMHSAKCDLWLPCFDWSWLIDLMALTI